MCRKHLECFSQAKFPSCGMARLSWRTSLGAQIQLGSLFSLLCLCMSLLSPSVMAQNAGTGLLTAWQGSAGLPVWIFPFPASYSQAPNLLQLLSLYTQKGLKFGKLFPLFLLL